MTSRMLSACKLLTFSTILTIPGWAQPVSTTVPLRSHDRACSLTSRPMTPVVYTFGQTSRGPGHIDHRRPVSPHHIFDSGPEKTAGR